MASSLNAELFILKIRKGHEGEVADLMVRRSEIEGIMIDIKIIMLGSENSGKSTLVCGTF
jgi:GTPase